MNCCRGKRESLEINLVFDPEINRENDLALNNGQASTGSIPGKDRLATAAE